MYVTPIFSSRSSHHSESLTIAIQYIKRYTQRRSRDPSGQDYIAAIDNTRNGIFLNKIAHHNFGETFAVLLVRAIWKLKPDGSWI